MNELNKYDIFLLDVFVLNYYGILVFFQICKTTKNTVFLVELGTKKYRDGITLTKNLKTAKNPYIILNNNTHTKSQFEIYPVKIEKEPWLPIEIGVNSRLFKEALNRTDFPLVGTVYAVPLRDYANKYWVNEIEMNINGYA